MTLSTGRKNGKSYLCAIVKSVIFNWLRDCISSGYKKDITAWTNKHYHAGFSTVQIVQWPAKIAQCFTQCSELDLKQDWVIHYQIEKEIKKSFRTLFLTTSHGSRGPINSFVKFYDDWKE